MGETPDERPLMWGGWPGEGVSAGDEGRLGVIRVLCELSGPAAALLLLLGARVFVAGLLPLAGRGRARLVAGRRRHLKHHHTSAWCRLEQPCVLLARVLLGDAGRRALRKLERLHHRSRQETHRGAHGGVVVGGEQAVAGLHARHSHCPLSWLAGHKHRLLVRLLRDRNLIRLHWRVLDHHALHLVGHIALLVASESVAGCWLHAHHGLVAGRWVWHHGLVHLLLGQVLALRAVIGQLVERRPILLLLLLVGALWMVSR